MISEFLISVARCPCCRSEEKLLVDSAALRCRRCSSSFPYLRDRGYVDLRPPPGTFGDLTEYAEEELYHREGPLRPPLLSARIKIDQMMRMLRIAPSDRVLDIGCGNGRAGFFLRTSCGQLVGIDAGEHFAVEALGTLDLARGDIRRLPFAEGSFDKAYALDVLEHLTEDGVRAMLSDGRRVLRPGGALFVYSHVMMRSRLAAFQRGINRLVQWLDRRGWVDNQPERQRKADHRNALTSYELLGRLVGEAGFQIERIRYYNVVLKALIEDLLLPLVEHNFYRRRGSRTPRAGSAKTGAEARLTRPDVGRWAHPPLALATALMKLDVALFGRIRTGPFFMLLRAVDHP